MRNRQFRESFDVWLVYVLREPCDSGSGVGYNGQGYRHAWVATFGPIPDGLVVDHVCGNRACKRLSHLDVVTRSENSARGNRGITEAYIRAALVRTRWERYEAMFT